MALRALALAVFIYLPGCLLAAFFFGGDSRFSSGERVFLSAVTGSGVTALSAAALGLAGVYSKWSLLLSWVCICLVAAACRVRSSRMGGAGLKGWALIALLVAAALALFLPPNRVVFGWNDDGVYADMAARLAREGDIYAEVDTVREVAPERRDLVFVPNLEEGRDFQAYLYKQYFITDFGSGKVVPQFFYPWPALMAVFATFLGLQRMFYAVTFAALLYLGGVFLVARRMLGRPWSAAVLLLALLSPLLLYFSRYTTSETLTGAFFLAAVLPALGRGPLVPWGRREAALSALLLTMAFLTRIDMLLLLAPLAASFAWKGIKGEWRGADTVFSLLCVGGAGLALLAGRLTSAPYFTVIFGDYRSEAGRLAAVGLPLLALLLLALALRPSLVRAAAAKILERRRILTVLTWVALAAAFVFLYYVRPQQDGGLVTYPTVGKQVLGASYDPQNLVRWGWYFSLPGLLLIFGGYALALSPGRKPPWPPLAACGLFFTAFYLWKLRCTPLQVMSMRRLMPVIFPAALLMMGLALRGLWGSGGKGGERRWSRLLAGLAGKAAALSLLLYLLAFSVSASRPIFGLSEGGNQLEAVREVHQACGDGTLLMDYNAGDLFGPPLLAFTGQPNAWLAGEGALQDPRLPGLLSDLGFPDRPVYLLWRPSLSVGPEAPQWLALEEVARVTWREENLEVSFEKRPSARRLLEEEFPVYRLLPRESSP